MQSQTERRVANFLGREPFGKQMQCDDECRIGAPIGHMEAEFFGFGRLELTSECHSDDVHRVSNVFWRKQTVDTRAKDRCKRLAYFSVFWLDERPAHKFHSSMLSVITLDFHINFAVSIAFWALQPAIDMLVGQRHVLDLQKGQTALRTRQLCAWIFP